MILPTPRVIAIDDEVKHLDGLAKGLNQCGAACLPIHFTSETTGIPQCPYVRVIFADLHLSGSTPGDHAQDFSTIGGLIESTLKPAGPYLIVLWTMYPEQANELHAFLKERLKDVTKPFAVQPLKKADHLDPDGGVKSTEGLAEAIREIVTRQPQVGVLLNWEEQISGAAADTISSILELAEADPEDVSLNEGVGRLLANLAVGTVGKEHVGDDRFRAVNDALLPILADRIAAMHSREADNDLWQGAFGKSDAERGLSSDEAAKLNRLLHIASPTAESHGAERGAVIALPQTFCGDTFEQTFGLVEGLAAQKQFGCESFEENLGQLQWVLVQTQAACDYAQTQPGPLPFHLGLSLPEAKARKGKKPPVALWISPCFEFNEERRLLHVNARFQMSLLSTATKESQPLFRLREQLLNDLIHRLHSHGARPGIISFRESKKKGSTS